jgi:hypothetical protein
MDAIVLGDMDSPGTSPEYIYDEATGEYMEVDCEGVPYADQDEEVPMVDDHIEALKRELPSYAYSMRACLDFIWTHPGCTKAEVKQACGRIGRNAEGRDSIDRLARRKMIYNLGRPNCHAWYVWQPPENNGRPAGTWAPTAHP